MSNPSPIVHIELSTADHNQSTNFYTNVFNWKTMRHEEMNYTTFSTDQEGMGGGFNPISESTPAGSVIVYIGSEDIDADLAKIVAEGGKVIMPKSEIPNTGWFAFFSDPSGNTMALYTGMPNPG